MAVQRFDELDQLRKYSEIWFDKMDIPQIDKDRRVELSLDYCEIIIMLFEMIEEDATADQLKESANERLNVIASNYIGEEDVAYINDWAEQESDKIIDMTLKHIEEIKNNPPEVTKRKDANGNEYTIKPKEITFEEFDVTIPESEYWTSNLRGLLLGIECATCISNYYELYDALEKGYTHKVWITEADDRVRPTHEAVDHSDIPITDLFLVGDSYLLFPGDVSNGASEQEIANCRCHIEYY